MNKQPHSNIFLLILLIGSLLLTACKKEVDTLPPATQKGLNTFGCLLNKKAWIPTGGGFFSLINPTSGGFFVTPDGSLNIYIAANSERESVEFFLYHAKTPGIYKLNTSPASMYPESYGSYSIGDALGNTDYFFSDHIHTGSVTITRADITNRIVSGTFDMQLFQSSSGRVMNITKGRFDFTNH